MRLSDLPHFSIRALRRENEVWLLEGDFDHLKTVQEGPCWLYKCPDRDSIYGNLEALSRDNLKGTIRTEEQVAAESVREGMVLPWLNACWQPYYITKILDTAHHWEPIVAQASDSYESYVNGHRTWRKAAGSTQQAGERLVQEGWKYESCMLCYGHINPGSTGYLDDDGEWLCECCFKKNGLPHDLAFIED